MRRRPGIGARGAIENRGTVEHGKGDDVLANQSRAPVAVGRSERVPSAGGFQADDATPRGGTTDRSAPVIRMRDGRHAGGDGSRSWKIQCESCCRDAFFQGTLRLNQVPMCKAACQ